MKDLSNGNTSAWSCVVGYDTCLRWKKPRIWREENDWLQRGRGLGPPLLPCANLQFNCSRLCSPRKKKKTSGKQAWKVGSGGRSAVTQPGAAALNSILAAFVGRQTMASSVEGAQVDFQLLSEDTRYWAVLCVQLQDKLSICRPFWTWAEDETWHTLEPQRPKIFQSLKNFGGWCSLHFFLPKSRLGRRKYLSFDRCVNTPGCPQDTSDVVEMRLVEPQENGIKSAT